MSHQESSIETPEPPSSLPKKITESIPNQSDETLRETVQWIEAILDARDQDVTEEDIPDSAEVVGDDSNGATYVKEKVKCGDDSCHCADGELHGPYVYSYKYVDGKFTSEYEGKPGDVDY